MFYIWSGVFFYFVNVTPINLLGYKAFTTVLTIALPPITIYINLTQLLQVGHTKAPPLRHMHVLSPLSKHVAIHYAQTKYLVVTPLLGPIGFVYDLCVDVKISPSLFSFL